MWPSFLELSFANFERRPWSHTYSCATLHTCCCSRLSSSPPHTAGAQKKARETSHTTNAFFLGPLVVCEISSRPHWTESAYAVCIPQEISSRKSKTPLCSLLSRCSEYILFRRRAFVETRKAKAIAGQIGHHHCGFSRFTIDCNYLD